MSDITAGYIFANGATVTATKLNDAIGLATIVDGAVTTAKLDDGAVTTAELAAAVVAMLLPAGAVMPFAMNSAPTGWLAADGAAVSRTTYAALFAAVGTTYGAGNGSTTFNVPDLRGYFVRGSGTNADGAASGTFGTKVADELKSHVHITNSYYLVLGAGAQYSTGLANGYAVGGTCDATGGAETRPKNIAMLYCVKT